ncbi:MAG: 50S ribosomal protein L35ae [Nanoarchaeota archaeon]|nr:50S ribosomal protein L35ae [Nanoarchaeota archaeon]
MEGVISNFRRGRHTVCTDQMIVVIKDVDKKDKTKDLIGKKVLWTSPGKKIIHGVIKRFHGNKGALRVKFETGMPGQSIGTKVKIE